MKIGQLEVRDITIQEESGLCYEKPVTDLLNEIAIRLDWPLAYFIHYINCEKCNADPEIDEHCDEAPGRWYDGHPVNVERKRLVYEAELAKQRALSDELYRRKVEQAAKLGVPLP
jgi:hypothetical protein